MTVAGLVLNRDAIFDLAIANDDRIRIEGNIQPHHSPLLRPTTTSDSTETMTTASRDDSPTTETLVASIPAATVVSRDVIHHVRFPKLRLLR